MSKGYAIITGAGVGIGKELAFHLALKGYDIVLTYYQHRAEAQANAEELNRTVRAKAYSLDVRSWESLCAFREAVFQDFGEENLKILINNAGTRLSKSFLEFTPEEIDEVLDVSYFGTLFCSKAFLNAMYKNGCGDIISISANEALRGHGFTNATYSAAKGSVIGMNRALRLEAGMHGIKCNVIAPGYIETEAALALGSSYKEDAIKRSPLGKVPTMEELLAAVDFILASPTMTGQTIAVNSGCHVW